MGTDLIINVTLQETRVALMANNVLTELYIERSRDRGIVGNLYKGRVVRVLPGMQAAFVDIGLDRAAFLYVTDVFTDYAELEPMIEGNGLPEEGIIDLDYPKGGAFQRQEHVGQIEDLLKEGQEILVQVAKEPMGGKGARITTYVTLPGRHLVLMPTVDHIGISRRIEDEKERKRLRKIIEKNKPVGYGAIVRTVGEGKKDRDFKSDMDFLVKLWHDIQKRWERTGAPSLLHQDLNLTLRAIRDLFTPDVDRLIIDSHQEYENSLEFIEAFMPRLKSLVEHYDSQEPIFDHFGIEMDVSEALGRKVWLKSGGYIIIDQTEALTAIDVNTGRYVGKRNLEETILKTNLEAVKEVVYQLRLRNIGGLIIIDFIDMENELSRERVFNALFEALKTDKAKTNILKISELGLVEMTRKRTRENIVRTLCDPCPYCEGRGYIKSTTTICYEIFRQIRREIATSKARRIVLRVHPEVADLLYDQEHQGIEALEHLSGKRILIKAQEDFHIEQFEINA